MNETLSEPFRLFAVRDPRTGKRRQLTDETEARRLAGDMATHRGGKPADYLAPSRTFYVYEFSPGARRSRRVNTRETTLYMARQWRNDRIRGNRGPVKPGRALFEETLDAWLASLDDGTRREKSLLDYRIQCARWKVVFKGQTLGRLSPEKIQEFLKRRQVEFGKKDESGNRKLRKASARLLQMNVILWRAFARWCLKRGMADLDFGDGLRVPPIPKREPKILTVAEIRQLLDACGQPFAVACERKGFRPYAGTEQCVPPAMLRPLVLSGVLTLLRFSNIVTLRWGDVDFSRKTLTIPPERSKTNVELVIPIAPSLLAMLLELPKGSAEDLVFGGVAGIKRSFASALRRAGLKGHSFHSLRRSSATALCQSGVRLEVVRKLGGWSTRGDVLEEHYRRISPEELRDAVSTLDELISGKSAKARRGSAL